MSRSHRADRQDARCCRAHRGVLDEAPRARGLSQYEEDQRERAGLEGRCAPDLHRCAAPRGGTRARLEAARSLVRSHRKNHHEERGEVTVSTTWTDRDYQIEALAKIEEHLSNTNSTMLA